MDQWLPNLSESSGPHRYRSIECSSLREGDFLGGSGSRGSGDCSEHDVSGTKKGHKHKDIRQKFGPLCP